MLFFSIFYPYFRTSFLFMQHFSEGILIFMILNRVLSPLFYIPLHFRYKEKITQRTS